MALRLAPSPVPCKSLHLFCKGMLQGCGIKPHCLNVTYMYTVFPPTLRSHTSQWWTPPPPPSHTFPLLSPSHPPLVVRVGTEWAAVKSDQERSERASSAPDTSGNESRPALTFLKLRLFERIIDTKSNHLAFPYQQRFSPCLASGPFSS